MRSVCRIGKSSSVPVEHPGVEMVIFDSTAAVGDDESVYLSATVRPIAGRPERFGAHSLQFVVELRSSVLFRLYVAHVKSCEVHVAGRHPVHGRGVDTRQPADPTSA